MISIDRAFVDAETDASSDDLEAPAERPPKDVEKDVEERKEAQLEQCQKCLDLVPSLSLHRCQPGPGATAETTAEFAI